MDGSASQKGALNFTSTSNLNSTGYAKSNSEHIVINAAAAENFRTVYQPLKRWANSNLYPCTAVFVVENMGDIADLSFNREDTLLDFGTGTGETAAAIAEVPTSSSPSPSVISHQ